MQDALFNKDCNSECKIYYHPQGIIEAHFTCYNRETYISHFTSATTPDKVKTIKWHCVHSLLKLPSYANELTQQQGQKL